MDDMKCLVVYYSRTGYTQKVAEALAGALNCEIEAIADKKERRGSIGYIKGIKDAVLNKEADIEKHRCNPSDFDLVIIGTPVWANKASLPVQAWLRQVEKPLPETAFFLTTRFSGIENTFRHMSELSGREPVARLALTDGRIKKGDWDAEVAEFADSIRRSLTGTEPALSDDVG